MIRRCGASSRHPHITLEELFRRAIASNWSVALVTAELGNGSRGCCFLFLFGGASGPASASGNIARSSCGCVAPAGGHVAQHASLTCRATRQQARAPRQRRLAPAFVALGFMGEPWPACVSVASRVCASCGVQQHCAHGGGRVERQRELYVEDVARLLEDLGRLSSMSAAAMGLRGGAPCVRAHGELGVRGAPLPAAL